MEIVHQPVMLKEVIDNLQVKLGGWYIDATLGSGGHTLEILKLGGKVLGIDQDPKAVKRANKRLIQFYKQIGHLNNKTPYTFLQEVENFSYIKATARKHGLKKVDGILFDLGFSSDQMADPALGLSFRINRPLDMRLDSKLKVTASDLLNFLSEKQIWQMFDEFGDEPKSRFLAKQIILNRPIKTTKQLAEIALKAYSKKKGRIHPATKIFQALRIAVNCEFDNLKQALPQAIELLAPKGRLVVISFHSGEDRIVKRFLKKHGDQYSENTENNKLKIITSKPITPSKEEIEINPRARSAKMRVAESSKET